MDHSRPMVYSESQCRKRRRGTNLFHSRQRQRRSSSSVLACLLHALLTFSAVHRDVRVQSQTVNVGSFIDEKTLNKCKDALNAADFNGDKMVTAEEYIAYIKGDAGPAIEVTADELVEIPLSLVMLFIRHACKCVQQPGAGVECCHGDSAHLNIDDDGSASQSVFLMDFCLDAQEAVADAKEGIPTATPTAAPTATPTLAPTPAPTFENQMSVRLQYTLTNGDGLDAEAVMTGADGNTLKADLEAATRTIVIRTLEEAAALMGRIGGGGNGFGVGIHGISIESVLGGVSRDYMHSKRTSIFNRLKRNHHEKQLGNGQDNESDGGRIRRLDYDSKMQQYLVDGAGSFLAKFHIDGRNPGNTLEEQAIALSLAEIYVHSKSRRGQQRRLRRIRRLAIYVDELPVQIYMILDDPTCPQPADIHCLVIFTRIFLLLEEGDDRDTVRQLVSRGMRSSFADGSFIEAISDGRRRSLADIGL